MNLKEIRDDVRSLIIEPTPGFRSDTELNRWINQAHYELAMHYRVEDRFVIRLREGVELYEAPDDLIAFKGAWKENGTSIPVIPIASGSDIAKIGANDETEMSIFHQGKHLILVPPPSLDQHDDIVTIFYERTPRPLIQDEDEPEIAEPYHRYLVSYAVMRALQKDEDYEAAAVYAAEYETCKQEIAGHKVPISKDFDRVLELVRLGILNAAEAAEWLNLPMKKKVWQRVEVEEKGITLLSTGAIDKADLIKNTVFTDREKIQERLTQTASDFAELPGMWRDSDRGE